MGHADASAGRLSGIQEAFQMKLQMKREGLDKINRQRTKYQVF
jgi:hypothetical protein